MLAPGPPGDGRRWNAHHADLVAHAKESLEAEVCGVLAGEFCEDEHGRYVSVEAAVRGTSVEHGVAFSDMDLFIQENFFAGQGQVALITDPLGGDEALCVNTKGGIEHVSRFWVDGRERKCRIADGASSSQGANGAPQGEQVTKSLRAVEDRLGQALQAVEDLRTTHYRFLMIIGMIVAFGVIYLIGDNIYTHYAGAVEPPKLRSYDMRIPVFLDGRACWAPGWPGRSSSHSSTTCFTSRGRSRS
ncbi:MAG: hypothetical protein GWP05_09030 [Anaerolineaceae bacterium]|nr:hypothetical protein [Anaerolineaceae bacterium]